MALLFLVLDCAEQVAALTERGQLATPAQRDDVNFLVDRLEQLKGEEEAYEPKDMVCCVSWCRT